MVWHFGKEGYYSVKSGYQIDLQLIFQHSKCVQVMDLNTGMTCGLLIYLRKSKFSCGGPLETCSQLQKTSRKRILCQLQSVRAAGKVWTLYLMHLTIQTPFIVEPSDTTNQDLLSVMQELSKKLTKNEMELLVAYWRAPWNARSNRIFEAKKVNPLISVVVEAFKRVKKSGKHP